MEIVSFQYLQKPFSRSFGKDDEFVENEAFPIPIKPYFKGTNEIPTNHPSRTIRKYIQQELSQQDKSTDKFPGNNSKSILHVHEELCSQFVKSLLQQSLKDTSQLFKISGNSIQHQTPFSNPLTIIPFQQQDFIIPTDCAFYNGNIFEFIKEKHPFQYDIIEIDPPWPNKSVKRSKLYHQSFIDFDSLSSLFNQIPIVSLCKENCYILVWITNDPRCMDLVLHFFANHGITHITTAYWVKVTKTNQPLVPLSCPTRETFERLVVGQFITETISDKRQKISIPKEKEELLHYVYQLAGKQCGTLLPQQPHLCNSTWINQIPCVVSSCSFHSRKPDCREFDFLSLPAQYHGLELFSRQLRSNWFSVGNEVFLFQNDLILKRNDNEWISNLFIFLKYISYYLFN